VNRAGPVVHASGADPGKVSVAVMAGLNVIDDNSFTVAMGGKNAELARAAEIAVAIGQLFSLNCPFCHDCPQVNLHKKELLGQGLPSDPCLNCRVDFRRLGLTNWMHTITEP